MTGGWVQHFIIKINPFNIEKLLFLHHSNALFIITITCSRECHIMNVLHKIDGTLGNEWGCVDWLWTVRVAGGVIIAVGLEENLPKRKLVYRIHVTVIFKGSAVALLSWIKHQHVYQFKTMTCTHMHTRQILRMTRKDPTLSSCHPLGDVSAQGWLLWVPLVAPKNECFFFHFLQNTRARTTHI